jgi:glycosyltransferase involved in cell wall biosynthesis
MKRDRIGLDVSILEEPRWTGVERAAVGLVRALGNAPGNLEVLLYSRRPVRWPFPLPERLVSRPIGGPDTFALWRELALPPAIRRDGIGVLHSPVAAIPLLTRVPRIATVHEMPWLRHPGIEGHGREAIYRARIKVAARVAHRLFVPSGTVAEDLLSLAPAAAGKVDVLPFGVEEMFKPMPGTDWRGETRRRLSLPEGPVVLFVGKARRRKNLPVLVKAMAMLRERLCPAPALVLAGVDFGDLPRHPGILPLGYVSDADLVCLYNLASVLAYPSLSEGFGFPPLEAMACGTPVVAGRAGALPEVSGGAALLVDPASADDLADAIASAIEDQALRRILCDRGHALARTHQWPDVAERARGLLGSAAA